MRIADAALNRKNWPTIPWTNEDSYAISLQTDEACIRGWRFAHEEIRARTRRLALLCARSDGVRTKHHAALRADSFDDQNRVGAAILHRPAQEFLRARRRQLGNIAYRRRRREHGRRTDQGCRRHYPHRDAVLDPGRARRLR